ncbi:MAG: chemotaxis protein CheW [Janthinobacterium lividum]
MAAALLERPTAETGSVGAELQVVALHLGCEIYGVDIACVNTVLTPQPITPVPNVPPHVQGVMNLRGRILPVIDLRTRFGMPALSAEQQKSSRIVIMDVDGVTAGLIVDSVSEVLRLPAASIEPSSGLLNTVDPSCLTGIGRVPGGRRKSDDKEDADRLILLLDIAQVLVLKSLPE